MIKASAFHALAFLSVSLLLISCGGAGKKKQELIPGNDRMIRLITVDPGHFHAALVQKSMYTQVSPDVHVYAPGGEDLDQHLERINAYNSRQADPAHWNEIVYTGPDFFEKMISEKAGNVVILSGNNRKKADYIYRSVRAGLNVLADKPMIINYSDFPKLEESFREASLNKVLLCDIMTERYEIATILQKELSGDEVIFGKLREGTLNDPAVTKVSVHHFSKMVSGTPLTRPAWFFDTGQQGEGIVDVTTHLVDLVQWECFPERILTAGDIEIATARHWTTKLSEAEFSEVTGMHGFPTFLMKDVREGKLNVYSNGEITWKLCGTWAKVSVEWKYRAPEGGGDTHYSIMKGTGCNLIIKQTAEEKYRPTLYVENSSDIPATEFRNRLVTALVKLHYDSLTVDNVSSNVLRVNIPSKYRVGHEEHFAQVMDRFLGYLKAGKIPKWEMAAMITKYYTTTSALRLAAILDHH